MCLSVVIGTKHGTMTLIPTPTPLCPLLDRLKKQRSLENQSCTQPVELDAMGECEPERSRHGKETPPNVLRTPYGVLIIEKSRG